MTAKKKRKFTMDMMPTDKALFAKAKKKSGMISKAATIRLALKLLAVKGVK